MQTDRHHVFNEPGQPGQLLGNLLRPDERAPPAPDFDEFNAFQLLNGFADRGSAHAILLALKPED
jgi:hypothetical protein